MGDGKLALFVNGINLDQFPAYVAQFPLLVTFNGSQFDVPFLRAHFPEARLDQAHIDLRFVLRSLGYRGGLKAIERNLGLTRDAAIQGVDGFEAVRLWHRYRRGDRAALMKLALYNLSPPAWPVAAGGGSPPPAADEPGRPARRATEARAGRKPRGMRRHPQSEAAGQIDGMTTWAPSLFG